MPLRSVVRIVVLAIAASFGSCSSQPAGPKLIEADGVTYVACGGAVWGRNEGNPKDPNSWSYEVVFKDVKGDTHELERVRMLKVTDLPSDTPACAKPR